MEYITAILQIFFWGEQNFFDDFGKRVRLRAVDKKNVGLKLNKIQKTIIDVIKENPHCTLEELAKIAKIKKRTVERNIKTLKNIGIIERIGAKRDGKWIVKI